ncbi:MAG TPA: hypothetical protein VFD64_20305, partial [Gemmatimonadaceae bacterium]|nr:hypothetical protein [Gemmatimonadaceae bacterium]
IAVVILTLGLSEAIFAETLDSTIGQGIGTAVADAFGDGSSVSIATSVTEVRFDGPRVVKGHPPFHVKGGRDA